MIGFKPPFRAISTSLASAQDDKQTSEAAPQEQSSLRTVDSQIRQRRDGLDGDADLAGAGQVDERFNAARLGDPLLVVHCRHGTATRMSTQPAASRQHERAPLTPRLASAFAACRCTCSFVLPRRSMSMSMPPSVAILDWFSATRAAPPRSISLSPPRQPQPSTSYS
jgi:hypothetical protein